MQEQEFDKGCILNVYGKFNEILRWEGTIGKEGEGKKRVERIIRPCNGLKKRGSRKEDNNKKGICLYEMQRYKREKKKKKKKKKMEREEEG